MTNMNNIIYKNVGTYIGILYTILYLYILYVSYDNGI